MKKEVVEIPYNGKTGGFVYLSKRSYSIRKSLSLKEQREVEAMAIVYLEFYSDHKEVIDRESALFFASYILIPENIEKVLGKPLTSARPDEVAKASNVTESLASFRLGLEKALSDDSYYFKNN